MTEGGILPPVPQAHSGWYLLAFTGELTAPVTPFRIGNRRVVVVSEPGASHRVFDGVCPHRGASLGHGGTLEDGRIRCPFHGKPIALGASGPLCVAEIPSVVAGALLFACLDEDLGDDRGFRDAIRALLSTHRLVSGVRRHIDAPQELVIENAFDAAHFQAVHGVPEVERFGHGRGEGGPATIDLRFHVGDSGGGRGRPFLARAFSPSVVISVLGDTPDAPATITGATASGTGADVRVGFAVAATDGPRGRAIVDELCTYSDKSLDQDAPVWEHVDRCHVPNDAPGDEAMAEFRAFCREFRDLGAVGR